MAGDKAGETVSVLSEELKFTDFLDESFQELILGLGVKDREFWSRARGVIKPSYFRAKVYAVACECLIEYWDAHHRLPSENILAIAVSRRAQDPETRRAWAEATRSLYHISEDDLDRPFLESELAAFAQRAEAALAVGKAYKDIRQFDIDRLTAEMNRIQQLPHAFSNLGTLLRRDWHEALDHDERQIFATGFSGLDAAMRGGPREGELVVVLAPLKRGKTLVLINLGAALMTMGYHVVHYSLELYGADVLRRYVACISKRPTNDLPSYIPDVQHAIQDLDIVTPGDIVIKELSGRQATVDMIDSHMRLLESQFSGPVIPIIDYADLMVTDKPYREEWRELPELYVKLRALGREHGVPVITASQTNAGGFQAERLAAQHQSGSTRKGFVVDYMFSIDQNDCDYAVSRFSMTPFLNRNERKDRTTYWQADYACSRIRELTEQEYLALSEFQEFDSTLPSPKNNGRRGRWKSG